MINQVTLVGRLTKNAEVVKSTDGKLVVVGSIAQNVGKKGEEKAFYFDFFKVVESDKIASYLKRGTLVAISGSLTYKDKELDKKHIRYYSVKALSIDFLESASTDSKRDEKAIEETKVDDLPF